MSILWFVLFLIAAGFAAHLLTNILIIVIGWFTLAWILKGGCPLLLEIHVRKCGSREALEEMFHKSPRVLWSSTLYKGMLCGIMVVLAYWAFPF